MIKNGIVIIKNRIYNNKKLNNITKKLYNKQINQKTGEIYFNWTFLGIRHIIRCFLCKLYNNKSKYIYEVIVTYNYLGD